MARTAEYRIVAPLRNPKVQLYKGIPLQFSSQGFLKAIDPNDLAIISASPAAILDRLTGSTSTITLSGYSSEPTKEEAFSSILPILFLCHSTSDNMTASISNLYVFDAKARRPKVSSYQMQGLNGVPSQSLSFKNAVTIDLQKIYSILQSATKRDKSVEVAMGRLCYAIGRYSDDDRIIDLAVSLESIFNVNSEISFQFSLYNALLFASDATERVDVYHTLRDLYKKRSRLVHGSTASVAFKPDEFRKLAKIAASNILKKADIIHSHGKSKWDSHLQDTALGVK